MRGGAPTVVYIGSIGRSGSSLLERLLGQLRGVWPVGETVHMWRRGILDGERCGCGEPFPRCPFWSEVAVAAFGGWDSVGAARVCELRACVDRTRFIPWLVAPRTRPSFYRALSEYISYYRRLYEAVGAVSGCRVIVDSSKHGSSAFCLRAGRELDLRVVHLVRDSRAVAFSWTRKVRRPEALDISWMPTLGPAGAAWQWTHQNGALDLLAWTGTPTLRVRYEDLIAAPGATLARIAAFAGLEVDRRDLTFLGSDASGPWAELGPVHSAAGNPMRFTTGRIPLRIDDEWRTGMPERQRRIVTALTLPLLARYRYLARVAAS